MQIFLKPNPQIELNVTLSKYTVYSGKQKGKHGMKLKKQTEVKHLELIWYAKG